jgi:hypothetical protein
MFVSRRFANCVYAALQPILSFISGSPPHAHRYAGNHCAGKLFAFTRDSIKLQQLIESLLLIEKPHQGFADNRVPKSGLLHKRKPSGTRNTYHSAFRFGMQLALLTNEVT